jgi:hypothetical protein
MLAHVVAVEEVAGGNAPGDIAPGVDAPGGNAPGGNAPQMEQKKCDSQPPWHKWDMVKHYATTFAAKRTTRTQKQGAEGDSRPSDNLKEIGIQSWAEAADLLLFLLIQEITFDVESGKREAVEQMIVERKYHWSLYERLTSILYGDERAVLKAVHDYVVVRMQRFIDLQGKLSVNDFTGRRQREHCVVIRDMLEVLMVLRALNDEVPDLRKTIAHSQLQSLKQRANFLVNVLLAPDHQEYNLATSMIMRGLQIFGQDSKWIAWSMDRHISEHFSTQNSHIQYESLPYPLQRAFAVGHILTHRSPVKCAINYYHMFKKFGVLYPARAATFEDIASEFELEAEAILLGLEGDYTASLMLEETCSEPLSAMELALNAGSIEFIGSVRVARIMKRFWTVPLLRPPEVDPDAVFKSPQFSFWEGRGDSRTPSNMWDSNNQPFDRKDYVSPFETTTGLLHLFVEYPLEWFALPRATFMLDLFFFVAFVVIYFAHMIDTHTVGEDFGRLLGTPDWKEIATCAYFVGFIWHELRELFKPHERNNEARREKETAQALYLKRVYSFDNDRAKHQEARMGSLDGIFMKAKHQASAVLHLFLKYFIAGGNFLDITMVTTFLSLIALRILAMNDYFPTPVTSNSVYNSTNASNMNRLLASIKNGASGGSESTISESESDSSQQCFEHCEVWNGTVASCYMVAQCIFTVLLGFKLLMVFLLHPSLGPLLRIIMKMWNDVRNFGILVMGVIVSFIFVFIRIGKEQLPATHSNIGLGAFYLIKAMIGDFDTTFEQPEGVDAKDFVGGDTSSHLWVMRMALLIFVLISNVVMLNLFIGMMGKTYGDVLEHCQKEFAVGQSATYWSFDQNRFELPPPFNVLVAGTSACVRLVDRCTSCSKKRKSTCWHCSYCCGNNFDFIPTIPDRHGEVGDDPRHSHAALDKPSRMLTCRHCLRFRRALSSFGEVEAKTSQLVFMLVFWIPVVLVLGPLWYTLKIFRSIWQDERAQTEAAPPGRYEYTAENKSTGCPEFIEGTLLSEIEPALKPSDKGAWFERLAALVNENVWKTEFLGGGFLGLEDLEIEAVMETMEEMEVEVEVKDTGLLLLATTGEDEDKEEEEACGAADATYLAQTENTPGLRPLSAHIRSTPTVANGANMNVALYQLLADQTALMNKLAREVAEQRNEMRQLRSDVRQMAAESTKVNGISTDTKWIRKNTAKKRLV